MVGYRDAHTFLKEEFEQAGELYISTEDGSVGTKGNVMDAIRENALEADMIYACGPTRCFVRSNSMQKQTESNVTFPWKKEWRVESVPVLRVYAGQKEKDAHSNVHNKRICKDGPVFLATEVEI